MKAAMWVSPCTNHSFTVPNQIFFLRISSVLFFKWSTNGRHELLLAPQRSQSYLTCLGGLRSPQARASREADFSLGDLYLPASPPFFHAASCFQTAMEMIVLA